MSNPDHAFDSGLPLHWRCWDVLAYLCNLLRRTGSSVYRAYKFSRQHMPVFRFRCGGPVPSPGHATA